MRTTTATSGSERWGPHAPAVGLVVLIGIVCAPIAWDFRAAVELLAPMMLAVCAGLVVVSVAGVHVHAWRARRRARRLAELVRLVERPDAPGVEVRLRALTVFPEVTEAARALVAAQPENRAHAVRGLLVAGGASAALEDRSRPGSPKWLRVAALQDLAWLQRTAAIPTLRAAVADEDADVAWAGVLALGSIDSPASQRLLLDVLADRRFAPSRVVQVLEESAGAAMVPLLRERLRGCSARTAFWLAYLLGRAGSAEALDALLDLCAHEDANVRANAAEAVGRAGDRSAAWRLYELAADPVWFVRLHALRALAELGERDVLALCDAAARDPNPWLKRCAAEVVQMLEPTPA